MVWWMYRHQCPVMWLDHQPTNHLREQCSGYFALSLALHRHRHRRGSASWQPYSYSGVVTSRGRIGESKRTGGGAVWWDGIPRFLRARGPAAAVRPGAVQFCRRAGAEIIAGCRWPPNASRLATTEGMERKARRRPQAINRHRRATAAVRGTTSKWGSGRAERLVAAACAPIHVSPQWSEVK
jgi:hypothetical protein